MKIQLGLSSISGWNAPKAEAYRAVLEAFLQDGKYTGAARSKGVHTSSQRSQLAAKA
jgi:hypothetical protein